MLTHRKNKKIEYVLILMKIRSNDIVTKNKLSFLYSNFFKNYTCAYFTLWYKCFPYVIAFKSSNKCFTCLYL